MGQDEDSALIYGMPRVAFECGAVMRQCSLAHMAEGILEACGPSAPHEHGHGAVARAG